MGDRGPASAPSVEPSNANAVATATAAPTAADAPGRAHAPVRGALGAGPAAYAQALRIGRADLARLRDALPALVAQSAGGAEPPPTAVLSARSALHRVDDTLAMAPPAGTESLAADRAELAAGRAELPADGIALVSRAAERTSSPGAIAAGGLDGASAPLPYLDRIRAAFGRHDVSGIRTRTGGAAAEASSELGARAFAYGDRIGFAGAPDLHTAAHEAAHVVQQRAGVALAGGAGAEGDAYEEHADAVADAVVAGRSAEPLLDGMAGAGASAGTQHAAVQRKTPLANKLDAPINAPLYAQRHLDQIIVSIWELLWQVPLPAPHPRLHFPKSAGRKPSELLLNQIRDYLRAGNRKFAEPLYELLPGVHVGKLIDDARLIAPHEPADYAREVPLTKPNTTGQMVKDSIDATRKATQSLDFTRPEVPRNYTHPDWGPRGTSLWVPEVGTAIASAMYEKIVDSLRRMGGRCLAAMELDAKAQKKLADASIVATLPLDELVLAMLIGVVPVVTGKGDGTDNIDGRAALGHDRIVSYRALGHDDPTLANWLHVTSPADATVDDVIATVLGEGYDVDAQQKLWMMTRASPPYFWAPVWKVKKGTPLPRLADAVTSVTDFGVARVDVLAREQYATKPGTAGKPTAAPTAKTADPDAVRALDHARTQLAVMAARLEPWGAAGDLLGAARAFVARRTAEATSDPATFAGWVPAVMSQERALRPVSAQVTALVGELDASGVTPAQRDRLPSVMPLIDVLVAYATAAGHSHLPGSFIPAFSAAARRHARLPMMLAELKVADARAALIEQRDTQAALGAKSDDAADNLKEMPGVANRMAVLRAQAEGGKKVGDHPVGQLGIDAEALALRARMTRLVMTLDDADKRADAADMDVEDSQSDPYPVRQGLQTIRRTIKRASDTLVRLESKVQEKTGDPAVKQKLERDAISAAMNQVAKIEEELKQGGHKDGFKGYFEYVNDHISDAQLRKLVSHILLEIGAMLLTGNLIGAGMAALRGVNMARRVAVAAELVGSARASRVVFAAGEMVFQAAGATVVQGALNGGIKSEQFIENLLGNALTSIAMRPFQKLLGEGKAVEGEIRQWAERARKAGKFVVRGGVEVGVGIATNKVAHAIVSDEGLTGLQGQELATQAVSFLAGRMVAKRAEALNARIERAAETYGTWHFAELRQRSKALMREAAGLGDHPKHDVAARLMERQHDLLLAERDALRAVAQHDPSVDPSANLADLGAMGPAQAELPLHLAKLERVGGTDVFIGTPQQIENALAHAQRSGIPLAAAGKPSGGVWKLKSGDRVIEVHERALRPGETAPAPMVHEPQVKPAAELDRRIKVDASTTGALAKELKVDKIRIADDVHDGVEIHYEKVKTALGYDLRVVEVVVGRGSTVQDVRAHLPTIQRISQYNGLLGQLRRMWRNIWGKPHPTNPFKRGSAGWQAVEELRKLDVLIEQRGDWDPKVVDREVLLREIAFLTERRDFYADVIRVGIDTGVAIDGDGVIARPDSKKTPDHVRTTELALADPKWRAVFPRKDGKLDREGYYFRKSKSNPKEFELVVMPNAGRDPQRIVKKNGVLTREDGSTRADTATLIAKTWSPDQVVAHLWADGSFRGFAELLIAQKIASRADIDAAIRNQFKDTRSDIRDDTFRGNVKDRFRDTLKTSFTDTKAYSYTKMMELFAKLEAAGTPISVGDRGNLMEVWYQAQHAFHAEHHVPFATSRKGARSKDDGVIDLLALNEAIEVKDVHGALDATQKAQLDEYARLMSSKKHVRGQAVDKLRYVFTRPEGAIANLALFADKLGTPELGGKLSVVVFDWNGTPHTVITRQQALALKQTLIDSSHGRRP